jgi:catechol 2,3-dioxygenase-like lactoylglutathione lyase family enzyme
MLTRLCRLGLEVKSLPAAREFYESRLGLVSAGESSSHVSYQVGETTLVLRRPTAVPRGGLHTHYAFSTTAAAYDRWFDRLGDLDPEEVSFGSSRSLYVYDPDGNCVEIGGVDDVSEREGEEYPLTGVFEVVLEVADLDAAVDRYRALGFEVVDRGDERRRVRLAGPMDLELWEPQLGLADARGGVHVELRFETADPEAAVEAGRPWAVGPDAVDDGLRVRDDDGHYLTFTNGPC